MTEETKKDKQSYLIIAGAIGFGFLCFTLFTYTATATPAEQGQDATARMQKMEMIDSETGDIYCMWMKKGQWQQSRGACSSDAVQNMFGQAEGWTGQQEQQPSVSSGSQTSLAKLQSQINALNKKIADQQEQITALQPQQTAVSETEPELVPAEETPAEQPVEEVPATEDPFLTEETPAEQPVENPEPETPAVAEEGLSFGKIISSATAGLVNSLAEFVKFIISPFKLVK